ncbi:hypothetical protein XFLM_01815 [Xylella fastidiosa subsp. fastidiosa GB514]|jgi:hypothetical protein|nr:hypothetical protein XFLM_01815 [Xylella fastidiosa subsp. fastidiosa GB514]KAF0571988.1 hypothetical protein P305_02500 [Xylella fastidiosa subsp. fastidiosa Mus-1]
MRDRVLDGVLSVVDSQIVASVEAALYLSEYHDTFW